MPAILTSATFAGATRAQREFTRECVVFFGEAIQLFSVPKSVGQIHGLLYASPVPLGFPDIVELLQISKGSVSQGLQLLRSLGAIVVDDSRPSQNGEPRPSEASARGVTYVPELSLRKLVTGVLQERVAPLGSISSVRLKRLKNLAMQVPENTKFFLARKAALDLAKTVYNGTPPAHCSARP